MENFDESTVDYLAGLIQQSDKILLFGYGPTNFCMEYFEYKLNFTLNKNVIRVSQPSLIPDLLTEDSLLLIFLSLENSRILIHCLKKRKSIMPSLYW